MNIFIWLSTADADTLMDCPKWEKRKFEALGMAVLVPMFFGAISSCYAISTITDIKAIVYGFPVLWAFIIMSIDRVLLSTYRPFTSWWKKFLQFCLRLTIAGLMGLTISHPLTLLIFEDTINVQISEARQVAVDGLSGGLDEKKEKLNTLISETAALLDSQQKEFNQISLSQYVAKGIVNQDQPSSLTNYDNELKNLSGQKAAEDQKLAMLKDQYQKEISGANGRAGHGPQSRKIAAEIDACNSNIDFLSSLINKAQIEKGEIIKQFANANKALELEQGKQEAEGLKSFNILKTQRLENTKNQIENTTRELERLRTEAASFSAYSSQKVEGLETQKRNDILQRTLAMHGLFHKEGGNFAFAVYVIITGLFTIIDIIPLIAKFFGNVGIYDERVRKAEQAEKQLRLKIKKGEKNKPSIRQRVTL